MLLRTFAVSTDDEAESPSAALGRAAAALFTRRTGAATWSARVFRVVCALLLRPAPFGDGAVPGDPKDAVIRLLKLGLVVVAADCDTVVDCCCMRESESRFFTRVVSESRFVRTGDAGFVGDEATMAAAFIPFAETGIEEPRLLGLGLSMLLSFCRQL